MLLLGAIDRAHSTLSDHTENPVASDELRMRGGGDPGLCVLRDTLQRTILRDVLPEQGLDFAAHDIAIAAGLGQKCAPLVRASLTGSVEKVGDLSPLVGGHGCRIIPDVSLKSAALQLVQCLPEPAAVRGPPNQGKSRAF